MRSGQFSPMVQGLPRCVQNPALFYAQGMKALFRMIVFLSISRFMGLPDACFLGKGFYPSQQGNVWKSRISQYSQRVKIDSGRMILPPARQTEYLHLSSSRR